MRNSAVALAFIWFCPLFSWRSSSRDIWHLNDEYHLENVGFVGLTLIVIGAAQNKTCEENIDNIHPAEKKMLKRQWQTWMYNMHAQCHINTVHLIPCTFKSLLVVLASTESTTL